MFVERESIAGFTTDEGSNYKAFAKKFDYSLACVAHRMHNSVKDSVNLIQELLIEFGVLQEISNYFSRSPSRYAEYRALGGNPITTYSESRWLTRVNQAISVVRNMNVLTKLAAKPSHADLKALVDQVDVPLLIWVLAILHKAQKIISVFEGYKSCHLPFVFPAVVEYAVALESTIQPSESNSDKHLQQLLSTLGHTEVRLFRYLPFPFPLSNGPALSPN